jgi:DNA-binding MarR family transcriptional regulator
MSTRSGRAEVSRAVSREQESVPRAEGHHAEALMRLIHQVTGSNAERATMELNIRQRLVLQCLGLEGDRSIVAIGQRLGLSPSTMTGLVDRLEEQGYVKRRAHESDRRVRLLTLSRKGALSFRRERDFYRSLVDEILGTLGGEAKRVVLHALGALHSSSAETRDTAA